jgi:hypothetical protein
MSYGQRPIMELRLSAEPEELHGSWCRRVAAMPWVKAYMSGYAAACA